MSSTNEVTQAVRAIAHRTKGRKHGFIKRLVSPGDIGALIKPFVFLDYFDAKGIEGDGFGPHPHSGIATHTTFLKGGSCYGDSTGKSGGLEAGSLEWMRAGRGVWHWGQPNASNSENRGYQLWLALPEALEMQPPESQFIKPSEVESKEGVRILLGSYKGLQSPIALPLSITYLHVQLKDGERWVYEPGSDHNIAWVSVHAGRLHISNETLEDELAVFEEGNAPLTFVAEGDVEFVLGSAKKHPHDLITGRSSVHTSEENLEVAEANLLSLMHEPIVQEALRQHAGKQLR